MVATASTKISVMPASRMLSAISFGVFWRSAPSTSPIMRSRKVEPAAAVMRTLDPVRQHLRAAGHRRAVAAGFADDRRGFARDRRFVDRGDAFDHLAVGRDDVAGLDKHDVADLEAGAGHHLTLAVSTGQQLRLRLGAGAPQRIRLRLAAAFGDGFGEIGEQHGEPQPDNDLEREAEFPPPMTRSRTNSTVVSAETTATTNITGFSISVADRA